MNQEYEKYTNKDHAVWKILYDRQMDILPNICTKLFIDGIRKCGFQSDRVPNFEEVNKALASATGWKIYVVPGLIDNKDFFTHLSRKEFPATTWLRSMEELEYLEEPDMFHDVFGHIPLLSSTFFSKYLQGLSEIMLDYIDHKMAIEYIARLYWYTIEFGLIRENGELRIYGAGILSSTGESIFSISDRATHLPYDIRQIMDTPYIKDKFQAQYFVIESFAELYGSLPEVRRHLEHLLYSDNQKNSA